MAHDIVPELWAKISGSFESAVAMDPLIRAYEQKLEKGTATQSDLFEYTKRIGSHASRSLSMHLILEDLPDGRLYWNIAERTVQPMLEIVHGLVNDYGEKMQTMTNKQNGIGIKGVRAPFPSDRVRSLINKLATLEEGGANGDR